MLTNDYNTIQSEFFVNYYLFIVVVNLKNVDLYINEFLDK